MEMSSKGIIFDIKKYALHDGLGIRTTVFFKGCPLNCWWCHNPEGQNPEPERFWTNQSTSHEIIGREVTVDEVITEIEKDRIFYDESGGGATFSGGEPLMQPDFLENLLSVCQLHHLPDNKKTDKTQRYNAQHPLCRISRRSSVPSFASLRYKGCLVWLHCRVCRMYDPPFT